MYEEASCSRESSYSRCPSDGVLMLLHAIFILILYDNSTSAPGRCATTNRRYQGPTCFEVFAFSKSRKGRLFIAQINCPSSALSKNPLELKAMRTGPGAIPSSSCRLPLSTTFFLASKRGTKLTLFATKVHMSRCVVPRD